MRTGTIPVRTLALPDEYIVDGFGHRFIYAISEVHADAMPEVRNLLNGGIRVLDGSGNNATREDGNVVYVLLSTSGEKNGAYTLGGQEVRPCNTAEKSGENCDGTNAVFINTVSKSELKAPINLWISYAINLPGL